MESVLYTINNPDDPGNPIVRAFPRHYISISVVSIQLSVSATISVTFYDANKKRLDRAYLELTGNDYSNWSSDYWLVNHVLQHFEITIPGGAE